MLLRISLKWDSITSIFIFYLKKKRYLVYSLSHYEPHFSRTVLYPRVCSSLILYRNTWASVKSIHKQLYYPCGFQLVQGRHDASYPKHSLDQESCSFTSMSFVSQWNGKLSCHFSFCFSGAPMFSWIQNKAIWHFSLWVMIYLWTCFSGTFLLTVLKTQRNKEWSCAKCLLSVENGIKE